MKHIAPLKRHIFNYCETGMNRLDALFIPVFFNYDVLLNKNTNVILYIKN